MKKALKMITLVFLWALGSGCVSMQEYQDVVMENSQLKKEMRNSNQSIRKIEQEKNWVAKKNVDLKGENTKLKGDLSKLKKTLQSTQSKYDQIFKKKLTGFVKMNKINMGKEFQINPETGGIVLEGDIFFNPGSATLRPKGKDLLQKLVRKLSAPPYNSYEIEIAGHTDSDPVKRSKRKFNDNWWLSCARAHSVLKYIITQGVPQGRLFISGYSFFKPRSTNPSPKGKKLNRRVEIVLHQKGSATEKKL